MSIGSISPIGPGNVPIPSSFIPTSDVATGARISNAIAQEARTDALLNQVTVSGECPVALMEACKAFESFFLQMLFRDMRRTIPEAGGIFERSNAERIFTDKLDEHMAIMAANTGGIGLAAFMFQQMTREGVINPDEIH